MTISALSNNENNPSKMIKVSVPYLESMLEKSIQLGVKNNVKELADLGLSLNKELSSTYPLHLAVANNQLDIVTLLLQKGASINQPNADGLTAIQIAALQKNEPMIARLVGLQMGHQVEEAKQLIENPETARYLDDLTKRIDYMRNHSRQNAFDPLQFAVSVALIDSAEELLKTTPPTIVTEENGESLLHLAVLSSSKSMMEFMIDKVDVNATNNNGETALHYAAAMGNMEAVEILLRHGAKLDTKTDVCPISPLTLIGAMAHHKDPLAISNTQLVLFATASLHWLAVLAQNGWAPEGTEVAADWLSIAVLAATYCVELAVLLQNFQQSWEKLLATVGYLGLTTRLPFCLAFKAWHTTQVVQKAFEQLSACKDRVGYRNGDVLRNVVVNTVNTSFSLHSLVKTAASTYKCIQDKIYNLDQTTPKTNPTSSNKASPSQGTPASTPKQPTIGENMDDVDPKLATTTASQPATRSSATSTPPVGMVAKPLVETPQNGTSQVDVSTLSQKNCVWLKPNNTTEALVTNTSSSQDYPVGFPKLLSNEGFQAFQNQTITPNATIDTFVSANTTSVNTTSALPAFGNRFENDPVAKTQPQTPLLPTPILHTPSLRSRISLVRNSPQSTTTPTQKQPVPTASKIDLNNANSTIPTDTKASPGFFEGLFNSIYSWFRPSPKTSETPKATETSRPSVAPATPVAAKTLTPPKQAVQPKKVPNHTPLPTKMVATSNKIEEFSSGVWAAIVSVFSRLSHLFYTADPSKAESTVDAPVESPKETNPAKSVNETYVAWYEKLKAETLANATHSNSTTQKVCKARIPQVLALIPVVNSNNTLPAEVATVQKPPVQIQKFSPRIPNFDAIANSTVSTASTLISTPEVTIAPTVKVPTTGAQLTQVINNPVTAPTTPWTLEERSYGIGNTTVSELEAGNVPSWFKLPVIEQTVIERPTNTSVAQTPTTGAQLAQVINNPVTAPTTPWTLEERSYGIGNTTVSELEAGNVPSWFKLPVIEQTVIERPTNTSVTQTPTTGAQLAQVINNPVTAPTTPWTLEERSYGIGNTTVSELEAGNVPSWFKLPVIEQTVIERPTNTSTVLPSYFGCQIENQGSFNRTNSTNSTTPYFQWSPFGSNHRNATSPTTESKVTRGAYEFKLPAFLRNPFNVVPQNIGNVETFHLNPNPFAAVNLTTKVKNKTVAKQDHEATQATFATALVSLEKQKVTQEQISMPVCAIDSKPWTNQTTVEQKEETFSLRSKHLFA